MSTSGIGLVMGTLIGSGVASLMVSRCAVLSVGCLLMSGMSLVGLRLSPTGILLSVAGHQLIVHGIGPHISVPSL